MPGFLEKFFPGVAEQVKFREAESGGSKIFLTSN